MHCWGRELFQDTALPFAYNALAHTALAHAALATVASGFYTALWLSS